MKREHRGRRYDRLTAAAAALLWLFDLGGRDINTSWSLIDGGRCGELLGYKTRDQLE